MKFFIISYVNSLERRKHVACLIFLLLVKHSLYTRISLLYYSYIPWPTKWIYSVKRLRMCEIICGRKSTCMPQTKILTKTTQIWGFSKLRVKIKKKVLYRPTPFFNTNTVSIIWHLFTAESYFDSRIASLFFYIILGFFSGGNARWYLF